MSTSGDKETISRVHALGAAGYFEKPIDVKAVVHRLTAELSHGVRGHVQAQVSSLAINFCEEFGGAARFIAPDSKSHDAPRAKAARPIEDLPRVIRPELADGIKNPLNAHSQPPLGLARGGGDRLEDRLNRLLLPEDDAGGQRDLGILDVLLRQPLDEARGHERVVLRRLEHQRHQGERSQELLKIAVSVGVPLALADPILNFLP